VKKTGGIVFISKNRKRKKSELKKGGLSHLIRRGPTVAAGAIKHT